MATPAFRDLDALCNEILTLIEIEEAKLLNWGFFDVRSDLKTHLETIVKRLPPPGLDLWDKAQQSGVSTDDILENLVARKLVFILRGVGKELYRTRFAETIRLLYLLRQRFSFNDWQTASRLVSDIKIQLQRRRYPNRNIEVEDFINDLRDLHPSSLYIKAAQTLLKGGSGDPLKLARFQKEAILQQIKNLQGRGERALVIGAGTGSGKTKAFYIPALAMIAATEASGYWVKALALYPRTELLKDQLAEAFSEARRLDSLLKERNQRKITLGAYYGDVPESAEQFLALPPEKRNWPLHSSETGWICPFLRCPNPDCPSLSRDLVWYREDLEQERKENRKGNYGTYAYLRCPACGHDVTKDQIMLTREQMVRQPPDILFTTTEMLNRRLSRTAEHRLFGIDATGKPPRLVLLDEIHTYEGTFGAQVAYVLRRWRHARARNSQANLCFVGLSATLTSAEAFFSKLTGVPLHRVRYICPSEADLIDEGVEYNVVLKGDPVSGTSLLSTSIQTAMLLGRMLDPTSAPSKGAYGTKIFAFADKLDVLNRWYHIEQEAETKKNLSQFRDRNPELDRETRRRCFLMGQEWTICKEIGHELQAPLRIDLTSSQYRGVDPSANLVIATSTLEVGFNDRAVGAVIQHKSPRSLASFLQRKGRAGRPREMRPWMAVVTSAYGRDRWAFQHTENLFHPQLNEINLPLENYYVRKIQATYALMDWLAFVLKQEQGYRDIDVWDLLSSDDKGRNSQLRKQRRAIRELLEGLLHGERRGHFQEYLCKALDLWNEEVILSLLWREPRSLMFEVIPTIIRQLETNWQSVKEGQPQLWTDNISNSPMPDFVPPSLFADLNVPELLLHLPDPSASSANRSASTTPTREDEYLPLFLALTEFAPGHVNKRYARKHRTKEAHWLELPEDAQLTRGMLPLQYLNIDYIGVPRTLDIGGTEYHVYRPRGYTLGVVPEDVKSSSSGHLSWHSHFEPKSARFNGPGIEGSSDTPSEGEVLEATELMLTPTSPWRRFFSKVRSYTQVNGSWVEINRLATSVQVETYYERRKGSELPRNLVLHFEENSQPAALGFTVYADALRFEFQPLDAESIAAGSAWPQVYRHLGPEFFLYKLQHDVRLAEAKLSSFEIGWLCQLELSVLVGIAVVRQCSLQEAALEVRTNRKELSEWALRVIFQSLQGEEDEEETEKVGRLHKKLVEHIANLLVQDALNDNDAVLWEQDHHGLHYWLQLCYASSLGSTLFTALVQLIPDIDAESLVMDVDGNSIWISEKTTGGIGLISRIADAIALRPREFDLQMLDVLQHCDREQLAQQLFSIAHLIDQSDAELSRAFAEVRSVGDLPKQMETRRALASLLEARGLAATRELIVALNAKFLRPNSSYESDKLIATLVQHWQHEEKRIGCSIDMRVMAVVALRIPEIKRQVEGLLRHIGGTAFKVERSQIFNLLQSLLWLDCHDSCPDCIDEQHPFQQLVRPSRALLLALLDSEVQLISYGMPGWKEQAYEILASHYYVRISCTQDELEDCKKALLDVLTEPVEVGFQFFYPLIEHIGRSQSEWAIEVSIRELVYA
jgi:hypothetical protein